MALSLDKPKLENLAGDIWKSAERLRGKFKAYKYQNGILPIIVAGIDAQFATLIAYRTSLIHECVTGQRRVTDEDVRRARHSQTTRPVEHRA